MDIGSGIKEIRHFKNLTQKQLAELSNFSPSYICDIENNNKTPTVETIKTLAKCLDVDVITILNEPCCYDVLENNSRDNYFVSSRCQECAIYKMFK